jgi:hypothetical protein
MSAHPLANAQLAVARAVLSLTLPSNNPRITRIGVTGRRVYAAMRPGIAGPRQVSGRSPTLYHKRVTLDMPGLDMPGTGPAVPSRRGAG